MARFLKVTVLAILGLALVILGFVYDVVFAGIPYQDPPEDLQAQWELHKSIAERICHTGGGLFLLGVVLAPVFWLGTRGREG